MSANQKKQRKYDRNRKSGQNGAYKLEHRQEKSHIKRIKAHLARYGYSESAKVALLHYAGQVDLHVWNSAQEFIKTVKHSTAKRIKPRFKGEAMGGTATA